MRFGLLYEHQLPRPWDGDTEHQAVPGRARPGRARRPARHRLRLGGRAPLPRGVRALLGARGVPRRLRRAHEEHPPRPRHRAGAAGLQPSGARRRAHRHARPGLRRPRRLGHRRVGLARRARGLRHRSRAEEGDVGRGGRADRQHDGDEPVPRLPGQVLLDAGAQRRAEAACRSRIRRSGSPAPSARPSMPRRAPASARSPSPSSIRPRPASGRTSTTTSSRATVRADRPRGQRQHRHGDRLLGARGRRRGARAAAPRASGSSAIRSATSTSTATTSRA